MSSEKRRYELRARAERQEETRRRIAAATADLHDEVGPARTTIAEVARRAGVQRPTVYNNFPTERSLFEACSAHFLSVNPPPDFAAALAERGSPEERLTAVLVQLYAWFRRTRRTSGNVQRDRHQLPELDALLSETSDARMDELAAALARGFGARGPKAAKLRALVRLALDFATWQRLTAEGLSDGEAAAAMTAAVAPLQSAP